MILNLSKAHFLKRSFSLCSCNTGIKSYVKRDGLVARAFNNLVETLGFGSQHPKGKPQSLTTPVPRGMTPSPGFSRPQALRCTFIHAGQPFACIKLKVLKKQNTFFRAGQRALKSRAPPIQIMRSLCGSHEPCKKQASQLLGLEHPPAHTYTPPSIYIYPDPDTNIHKINLSLHCDPSTQEAQARA